MSELDLKGTMDALALKATTGGVTKRAHAYPEGSVEPPCMVVGYPTALDFDMTFKRGGDRAVFPLYFLVGAVVGKASRDALSAIITGAVSIKGVMDGPLTVGSHTCSVRVMDCTIERVTVASVEYLAATFSTEVLS